MPMNLYLPVGYLLEMTIPLSEFNVTIKSLARVARIADLTNGRHRFDVGLEFTNMPPNLQGILHVYLTRYLAQKEKL